MAPTSPHGPADLGRTLLVCVAAPQAQRALAEIVESGYERPAIIGALEAGPAAVLVGD